MLQTGSRASLIGLLAGITALAPAAAAAQVFGGPPILRAMDADAAHAEAAERCDREGMALQLLIVEGAHREAAEALERARSAGGGDDRAVMQSAGDVGRISQLRDTMISRQANCPAQDASELGLYAGYGRSYFGRVGLGFSGQQQENYAAESSRSVDTGWVGGLLDTKIGGLPSLRLWGQYGWGSESTTFDLPSTNQAQFGAVYTAPSPSGTSGVQLQQLGMNGRTGVRLRDFQAGVEIPFKVAENESPRPADRTFFVYSYYDRLERTHTGSIHAEADFFGNTFFFDQERRQQLDENFFAAGLGGRFELSPGPGWTFDLAGRAGAYYRDSSLESVESVQSNVVPAADQVFTTVIEDDDSGAGFDSEILFGIEHALLPDFSLTLEGVAGYRSSVGGIFNSSSSEQLLNQGLTTHIETTDMWWWRLQSGLTIRFGASGGR